MCYDKLHLDLSKRCRYFYYGHSHKCVFDVPCGMCEECIKDSQLDYFIRMKSEYDDCVSKGGKVAFVTFTYRDDSIPAYSYHYNSDTKEIVFDRVNAKTTQLPFIYSFDRKNLQRFFNSYRKRFERLGVKSPFRYLVVGEYGTKEEFTQRSHFHALIYFTKEAIDRVRYFAYCDDMIESVVLDDINELWTFGNCSKSKDKSLFLANSDACSYCSKYISKTMTLANLRRFAIFRDFIASHFNELSPFDYNYEPSIDGYFRYYLKRTGSNLYTLKSKNFGASALDNINRCLASNNIDKAYELFKIGYPCVSNGKTSYIGYSMYYFRKLCYNTRDDGTYYLNSVGEYFQKNILFESVQSFCESVSHLDFNSISNSEHREFCLNFMKRTPLFMIGFYKYFSRYRCYSRSCNSRDYDLLMEYYITRNVSLVDFDYLYDKSYGYLRCPGVCFTRDSNHLTFGDVFESTSFNFCIPFHLSDYDLFIDIVDNLISSSKRLKLEEKKKVDDMSKYLRDINNCYIYSINP